jgi:hypothetical protein
MWRHVFVEEMRDQPARPGTVQQVTAQTHLLPVSHDDFLTFVRVVIAIQIRVVAHGFSFRLSPLRAAVLDCISAGADAVYRQTYGVNYSETTAHHDAPAQQAFDYLVVVIAPAPEMIP